MNKIVRGAPAAQGRLRAVRGSLAWGGSLGALMWLVATGVMLPAASARANSPPLGVPDSYGATEDHILTMDVLANEKLTSPVSFLSIPAISP